jgi:hypothetical protein
MIENSINLTSKSSFINYLKELYKDGPGRVNEVIVQSRAKDGWDNEIKFLMKEYG